MAGVLRIDRDDDIVLRYAQAFRNRLLFSDFSANYPQHRLHEVTDAKVTKGEVEAALNANSVEYVSGAGHGSYDAFTGQQGGIVWSAGENLAYLRGKIVHLLSCWAGATLGRAMVGQGVIAFWGYTVEFLFIRSDPPPTELHQDALAEVFLRMDIIIDRGVLAGEDAKVIYKSIEQYLAKILPQLSLNHQRILLDNFLHLVCPITTWGDPTATL